MLHPSPSDAAEAGPTPVPWLPSKPRPRWRRQLFKALHLAGALMLLVYILVMGLLMMLLEIPKAPVRMLMKLGTQSFGMIVEHAYALPICKLHVTFSRLVQRSWNRRPYHTRYADIRTEVPLVGGGVCFIHAIPCMTDNFSYLIVDASGLPPDPPDAAAEQGDGLPACVVDPCDAFAVVEALELIAEQYYAQAGGLRLEAVLCTHRHWDHAGGNEDLAQIAASEARKDELHASREMGSRASRTASASESTTPLRAGAEVAPPAVRYAHPLRVYGGAREGAPGCTHKLWHGNSLNVGTLVLEALASPGHTKGSLMFRLVNGKPAAGVAGPSRGVSMDAAAEDPSVVSAPQNAAAELEVPPDVLFTGDTLFSGGCGAQFEGCELDIEHCFATVLAGCESQDALLFPGHEYTSMLLEHRLTDALDEWAGIEAPGQFLALCGAYYVAAHRRSLRDRVPTVPFMLKSERLINPHFDRSLLRYADVVVAMLEAQTGPRSLGSTAPVRPPALAPASVPPEAAAGATGEDRSRPLQPAAAAESTEGLLDTQAVDEAERVTEQPSAEDQEAASGASGAEAAEGEEAPASGKGGHFVTGAAAPAYQFAFLYKQDLDALREELAQERITGPEAAARLLECEQKLFAAPLLTGAADSFCGEGVEPWEEDAALSDDGQAEGPANAAPAGVPVPPQEPDDPEDRSEEPSWDASWPSEAQVTSALKVLGVLSEVPVGPKAPCSDEDLPVSLQRLELVLRRLHVSEEHLQALQQVLSKEDHGPCQVTSVQCSWCSDQSNGCQLPSRRQMQAMNSDEGGEVLPLRQVLQLLRPTPPQERSSMQRCFRSSCRSLRRLGRDVLELFCPPGEGPGEWQQPAGGAGEAGGGREKELEGSGVVDGVDFVAKHRRAVERVFCAHSLDKCPLCSCAFHARPATARRRRRSRLAQD